MGGADDDWVKAAMTDDAMVAELLLRLHRARPPPPPPPPLPRLKPDAPPLDWSVRQRRSKSVSINNRAKRLGHRGSPTTPLSWSGAASFSGGSNGVGSEDSSRPVSLRLSDTNRSKVIVDSEKTSSKKSKKKKTLTELKDEEHLLLKERRQLKKEMAAIRVSLDRQRATNEKLKRMKIESQPCVNSESTSPSEVSISGQIQHDLTACRPILPIAPKVASSNDVMLQSSTPNENADAMSDTKFVLPDLNVPFDEPSSDVICWIR